VLPVEAFGSDGGTNESSSLLLRLAWPTILVDLGSPGKFGLNGIGPGVVGDIRLVDREYENGRMLRGRAWVRRSTLLG
jgi:hypothetical protein